MANAQRIQIKAMANGTAYASSASGSAVALAAGATAFVYQHGTTTPATIFQAETGGTTIGQPLICDANGQPPGWVAGGQDLDIVYTYQGQTAPAAQLEPEIASSVENAQSVAAGNMGSTYALTLAVGDTLLTGTLDAASCTITPTGPAGSSATLHLTQDVTGGRLVVISGAKTPNGAGITLSSAGSKTDVVVVWTPDGVNFYAQAGGLAFA